MKPHLARALIVACFVLTIHLLCESCQNSFQQILQTRQQYGARTLPCTRLLRKRVISKMECLDICLRNPLCYGFQMKHKIWNGTAKRKHWICKINRRMNSTEVKLVKSSSESSHWIHFNVSSRELQQVSSSGRCRVIERNDKKPINCKEADNQAKIYVGIGKVFDPAPSFSCFMLMTYA